MLNLKSETWIQATGAIPADPRTALSVPICGSRRRLSSQYMNVQITLAATMLMASGTKITDLATVS